MNNSPANKFTYKINGMHCASCEVLIERAFKEIPGVERVRVNHANGKAELFCSKEPQLPALQQSLQSSDYTISPWHERHAPAQATHTNTKTDYIQIGTVFLILMGLYLILKQFDLLPSLGISDNMSYGFIFLIGLVAAMSTCLAVTGGLLLAVAAKFNERFPHLTGVQKLRPHLYFNIGRIVSYTVLGGVVGALGSVVTFSPRATGFLTIAASIVMIILGFQLLHLFPWMRRFQPKMPKRLAHKIHDLSGKESKSAPFFLGASTFFLPCGFTQALQLYVLATGDATTGALTMLAFSLGTLPALMSLSAISSFAKGAFQRHFIKVSGVLVVMLGLFNVNNGLALTGSDFSFASVVRASNREFTTRTAASDPNVRLVNGTQIVNMQVAGLSYLPSTFTVVQGVPVEWRIDARGAQGCAQVISVPKLGLVKYLSPTTTTIINFTPQEAGSIAFSCTMGMTTRGAAFNVVPNTTGIVRAAVTPTSVADEPPACDPTIADCFGSQKVSLNVSQSGIYPSSLTVKKGVPVDLTINNQVPLGGCMSVWVIPDYNVTIPMKVGTIKTAFTPTKAGAVAITCSMGAQMALINVVN